MGSVFRKPTPRPSPSETPQEEAAKQTTPERKPQEAGGIPTAALPSKSRRDRLLQSVVGGQLSGYEPEEGKLGYIRRQR
jgi:hypothetical protein